MSKTMIWSQKGYQSSLSSRCWAYTPYAEGWDHCPDLRKDRVLRDLVEEEYSLMPIPAWARDIVERSINFPPFCPHWAFPSPYLEVLDAIGTHTPAAFVHGCYTANRERKERMLDYVFCLDAWLAGAEPGQAASELTKRGNPKADWQRICSDLWNVLGKRSELKEFLLRRIAHRQRWWIQSLVWDDDSRDVYCRDQYLGDVNCRRIGYGHYGNPDFLDPYFAELQVPEVKRLEKRLSEICPDWEWFRSFIHDSWLCAPKAFRFLERLLWCVGKEKRAVSLPSHPLEDGDKVPGFLQCEDTYWNSTEGKKTVIAFVCGVRQWVAARGSTDKLAFDIHRRLGDHTPVKLWLVRLYLRKLEFLNPYGAVVSV